MNRIRKLFGKEKKIDGKTYVQTRLNKVKKQVNLLLNTPESIQLRKDYFTFINLLYSQSPNGFINHMNGLLDDFETSQKICTRKCVSFNAHRGQDITNDIKRMTSGPNYGLAANFCVGTTVDAVGKKGINMSLIDELIDSCSKINTQKDEILHLIYMWFVGGEEEGLKWFEQFDEVLIIIERAQGLFRELTSSGKPTYIYTARLNKMLKSRNPSIKLKTPSVKAPTVKAPSVKAPTAKAPPKPPKPTRKISSPIKLSMMTRKRTPPIKPPKPIKKMASLSLKMISSNKTQKCGKDLPRCKKGFRCDKNTSTCEKSK